MTNEFHTVLTDLGVFLILLLIVSLIIGAFVFVAEAFRRTFRRTADSNIGNPTEPKAAAVATTNAP
jgi:hypothetical protein